MENKLPKISVITVAYNAALLIEDTIHSVLGQDYAEIEYIIIDGASTDSTLDIIQKHQEKVILISEPDKGVYDAMNKGIEKASGEWILFMNAGDHFYSKSVISDVMKHYASYDEFSVVYGDAEFRLKHIAYINEASDEVSTNQYMPFSHQAAFTRTNVAKQAKFDLKYKIAADAAFFLRLIVEGHKMKHISVTVCSYNALEGLSADNDIERSKEIVALQAYWNKIDPNSPHFNNYIKEAKKRQLIKKLLPNFIWTFLRERRIKKQYKPDKITQIG